MQTPAGMALGTSAWQPIYFSMLAQLRDAPAAQKRGEGAPVRPIGLGRFSLQICAGSSLYPAH